MKKLLYLGLLFALPIFAQPKKYQSLLWEISRNGLPKKSYIYGSMHVSDKVSYHLSDAFFDRLLASDFVATESDPATWVELYDMLAPDDALSEFPARAFYSEFYQNPLDKAALVPLFQNDSNIVNNLLSRTSETQKDYQEDTYLDMFIYQTGRKYNKKVVGLEDAKRSMISVMNAENRQDEPQEENVQAIVKMLKERSVNQAMLDFYREKNLDMLDSLYVLMTPPGYHKALILDRNRVMVNSIDSLATNGSLFAAVGAAHLPGKHGIIEILREKGYTVKPVLDSYSEKGRAAKHKIDGYFSKPLFRTETTPDAMISMPMLGSAIYNNEDVGTPDLANGGVVNLKRRLLRNYLSAGEGFNPKTLDSLFYENIPGTILQKKAYQQDNCFVYDISNKTKTGNFQHYRYYVTPLEIICASMNGNGDYVKRYENEVFANIKIKKYTAGWETVIPKKGGFSVDVPSYHAVYGDRESSVPENVEINAFDSGENAWYFVSERCVNDNATLEDTKFELKRIQDEFYLQRDIVKTMGADIVENDSFESQGTLGNKHFTLKTIVSGQKYFLLGTVNASRENTAKFLSSFAFVPFAAETSIKRFEDEKGHFEVDLPEKQNERYFWNAKSPDTNYASDKKNLFKTNDEQYAFTSRSGQTADIFAWTYHRYDFVRSRDTLLAKIRRNILDDYNSAQDDPETAMETVDSAAEYNFSRDIRIAAEHPNSSWDSEIKQSSDKKTVEHAATIVSEKHSYDPKLALDRLDLTIERPDSEQAVKYIAFVQDGYIWYIRSLVDKNRHQKSLAEQLADSFEPVTRAPQNSLFTKKTQIFIEDARSQNDSIRYSAFASVDLLQIDESDLPALKQFLTTFDFKPDETQPLSTILERIGKLNDDAVVPFLESCYKKENVNAMLQLAVIRALAKQKSKLGYQKIAELFEYDMPLSDNDDEISALFAIFSEDAGNSKALYPSILQYYGVSEYKEPIVSFVARLIHEGQVNPKKLKSYKKSLLADARLSTKRVSVRKAKQAAQDFSDRYYSNSPSDMLRNYACLLHAFKNDKGVSDFFLKAKALDLPEINFELARLDLENGQKPNAAAINALFENPEYKFRAYRLLYDANEPKPDWPDEEIARSLALLLYSQNENGTMAFVQKRSVQMGDNTATLFFFRNDVVPKNSVHGAVSMSKLVAVAFLDKQDGIDPAAWQALRPVVLSDSDDMSAQCEVVVDRFLNESHVRASFGKQTEPIPLDFDSEY